MGIKLIRETESFVTEFEGCTFNYRRLPYDKKVALQKEHTHRGELDEEGLGKAALEYSIHGWDGPCDDEGNKVPFSPGVLFELPWKAIEHLLTVCGGSVDGTDPF